SRNILMPFLWSSRELSLNFHFCKYPVRIFLFFYRCCKHLSSYFNRWRCYNTNIFHPFYRFNVHFRLFNFFNFWWRFDYLFIFSYNWRSKLHRSNRRWRWSGWWWWWWRWWWWFFLQLRKNRFVGHHLDWYICRLHLVGHRRDHQE